MAKQPSSPNPDSGDDTRPDPTRQTDRDPSQGNKAGKKYATRDEPTQLDSSVDETINIDDVAASNADPLKSLTDTDANVNLDATIMVPSDSEKPADKIAAADLSKTLPNIDPTAITEQIEQTLDMEEAEPSSAANQKTQSDGLDRTLSAADLERTLAFDDGVKQGGGTQSKPDSPAVPQPPNHTVAIGSIPHPSSKDNAKDEDSANDKEDDSVATPAQSIMTSREVGATINPRELSDEDAVMWESLAKSATHRNEPSQLAPAIERSLRETNLRIVPRNVTKGSDTGSNVSDYQLVRLLGKGGMGNVYVAKQESLDRMIAVKIIRPLDREKREKLESSGRLADVEQNRRQQFLSEAVVTGDLDHPNIVPIHDIAVMGQDTLFYAMKRVVGTPWNKVIAQTSRDENLEILLKVADAVGFAHTRGVVHRDIKPENIMLGDFGVVMVMDWGLALPTEAFEKHESVFPVTGLGGTPAFMAPEMATGPISRVTVRSDVYLLGATLFMIITGEAPHHGSNVRECLKAVANNTIRDVTPEHQGELMNIALKAMATKPSQRYPDVPSFQKAIRDYRSNAESIALTTQAKADFENGMKSELYADFSRAIYGYEEALTLWSGNQRAIDGLGQARLCCAEIALKNQDYDTGLQVLDPDNAEHVPLIEQLKHGLAQRAQRLRRFRLLRLFAIAMLVFILIGGTVATLIINQKRQIAEDATAIAMKQTKIAFDNQEIAERQTKLAKKNETLALENERKAIAANLATEKALTAETEAKNAAKVAEQAALDSEKEAFAARDDARKQQRIAEYEGYISSIGLAKARIDRNNFSKAHETLKSIADQQHQRLDAIETDDNAKHTYRPLAWEYRWLMRQLGESDSTLDTKSPVVDLATARDGRSAVAVLADGTVERMLLSTSGSISSHVSKRMDGSNAVAAAVSEDGSQIALGTASGEIELWDATLEKVSATLAGHTRAVSDLKFAGDTLLVSASQDRTARVWDLGKQTQVADCWHIAPVLQLDVVEQTPAKAWLIATAAADASAGRIVLWQLSRTEGGWNAERRGDFDAHDRPVSSIALSRNGELAASGDDRGHVLIWRPSTIKPVDYSAAISSAIESVAQTDTETANPSESKTSSPVNSISLDDPALGQRNLANPTGSNSESSPSLVKHMAHEDAVRAIEFSADGQTILTAADDYTIKLWKTQSRQLDTSLRGHGGWVTSASFLGDHAAHVLSASMDRSVRSWNPSTYVGAAAMTQLASVETSPEDATNVAPRLSLRQAHKDEILSARFSPDGQQLVTSSRDRTAKVMRIDADTLALEEIGSVVTEDRDKEGGTLREGTTSIVMSMALDPTRRRLYVGGADAILRIWDLDLGTELGELFGTGLNQSFALSKTGRYLLTGSSSPEQKARLFRVNPSGRPMPMQLFPLGEHEEAITAYAISDDETRLFTGDRAGRGFLWNMRTGKTIGGPIDTLLGNRINAACFMPNGKQILVAADDELLSLIDLRSKKRTAKMKHDGYVTSVSLSPEAKFALTVCELSTNDQLRTSVHLWDLQTRKGRELQRSTQRRRAKDSSEGTNVAANITDGDRRIASAEFSEEGHSAIVAIVSGAHQATRVDSWTMGAGLQSAKKTSSMELPSELGATANVKPINDGQFVSLNGDGAFLWDKAKGTHLRSFRANAAVVQSSFSSDGKYIVTGSRSIKIWDSATLDPLGKLEVAHDGPVRSVEFAQQSLGGEPDYRLVSGGDDGKVRLWHWNPTSKRVTAAGEFDFGSPVRSVQLSFDGMSVLACGSAGTAKLWRIDSPASPIVFQQPSAGGLVCITSSRDGKWIAVGSTESVGYLWQVPEQGEPVGDPIELRGHSQQVDDIAILQDASQQMRVFTASDDQTARVWDPRIEQITEKSSESDPESQDAFQAREVLLLEQHTSSVTAVDVTASGELLLTASRDGTVILWPADITSEQDSQQNSR
ncbi:protein kinase domain-containing protein [Novipirellula sp. SH528]|uniref:protein kinase domain-containing protein n=1 Tax=Novipirellula sp. SH528 TaxID=3454466 RepID=UPI003FA10CA1